MSEFSYMQGGVFSPWGDFYLSVGKSTSPASETRGGLHLFRRTPDGSAFHHIHKSVNESHDPGDPVFAYEYHPTTLRGQEPEGIDWWNRDNPEGARYRGQLHAVLLNNDRTNDDQVWLKHYRVDYSPCVGDADTDGDGLSDLNEAYVHNSHPLLRDTDMDGQSDGDEIACGSDLLDKASLADDLDGDTIPDCRDLDDDNDGQSDVDELGCGSNPRDAASQAPDLDGDGATDCADLDDDNDSIPDNLDTCPTEVPGQGLDADQNGCTDTVRGLIEIVRAMPIPSNIKTALLAKLQNALHSNQTEVAELSLSAFIKQVTAQTGKHLTTDQAALLAAYANNILQLL